MVEPRRKIHEQGQVRLRGIEPEDLLLLKQ